MANQWVVNASPLILLGKLNRLELLEQLAFVKVPDSVIQEIKRGIGKKTQRQTLH